MAALGLGGAVAVSYAAAPLAVLWLVVVLALWRVYPSLLLEGARSRRSDVALPLTELLDARTLRVLEAPLTDPDRQRCRAACALLREAGGARVVIAVARALAIAPAENRGLLLGTLAQLLEQGTPLAADEGAQVRASLAQAIARPDGLDDMERAGLVQGYARVGQGDAKGAIDLLDRCRDDPSPTVRLAAEIVLAGSRDGHVLAEAIRDPNLQRRRVAQQDLRLELLLTSANGDRSGAFEHRLMLLAGLLESPEDRAAAAGALADVAARHGAHALPAAPLFLAQRTSDDTAVRTALLRFIGHAGLVSEARWALSRLNARSREEGRAAAESLTRLAPGAMDVILEAANSGGRRQRQAVVPILRALAVADETLAALVSSELEAARRARALTRALASGPISPLVLQRLGERVEEALSSILALLAAREAEPRLAELGALLERVRDGRDRAALLEAMDALLPSEESAPLLALLDDSEPSATTPRGAAGPGGAGASFEEALRSALEDEDELTRHFLAATLDEGLRARLGVASAASAAAAPLAPAPAASEARRGGEDVANLSEVEIVLHLRSLSLFERLRTRQLGELAGIVREVTRPPGNVIVTEGDFAECMYLIVSGTVHISREGRRLAELGPRDFFGEMAVLDGELRSATVIAATRVHLLRIDRADLLGVMDEHPGIAITICQALSRRVRSLNDEVRELRRSRSV
jgi:hypothetical protein